jgi:aspartate/methionine/tyrosine aminotransferase
MQVASIAWSSELKDSLAYLDTNRIQKYPGLVTQNYFIEEEVSKFLERSFSIAVDPEEVIPLNGVLTSPSLVMTTVPQKYVLHPSKFYSKQISSFKANGKIAISIDCDEQGLMDLDVLEENLEMYKGEVAFVHFNNNLGFLPTVEYLDRFAELLERYDTYCTYDYDSYATAHTNKDELIAIRNSKFRRRAIFLFNLSKEFNAPGIRVGFGVGPSNLIKLIKKNQVHKIEILPVPSVEIAKKLLNSVEVKISGREFSTRMDYVVKSLNELSWSTVKPDIGINLFIDVPKSFTEQSDVNPSTLFSYYILKQTKVVLRPGVVHGKEMADTVRIVLSSPIEELKIVFDRFKNKDIRFNMDLPSGLIDEFKNA